MIDEPWFWQEDSVAAKAITAMLAPIAFLYDQASKFRRRLARPLRAPTPVICIGNLTVGGVGKTPFAIMLAQMLQRDGHKVHFLSRGHGGAVTGPMRVDPEKHSAMDVGDEPLLLAKTAPTWVSRDKRAGAMAASKNTDVIIMDDGFQNPTVEKDFSILLLGAGHSHGDQKVFPAGPLRERFEDAKKRADKIIAVNSNNQRTPSDSAFHHAAWLEPTACDIPGPVFAFCGIGNPLRFFRTLSAMELNVIGKASFPDHYLYSHKDVKALTAQAKKQNARLITTEKDWVRINTEQREDIEFLPVRMRVSDEEKLLAAINKAIAKKTEEKA